MPYLVSEIFPAMSEEEYDRLVEMVVEEVANKLDYDEIASVVSDRVDLSYQIQEEASEAAYIAMGDLDVDGLKERVEFVERELADLNYWKADRHHQHED